MLTDLGGILNDEKKSVSWFFKEERGSEPPLPFPGSSLKTSATGGQSNAGPLVSLTLSELAQERQEVLRGCCYA